METTSTGAHSSSSFDPAADLALLGRARASVAPDQFFDFGPWWYAPLLATTLGGLTVFGQSTSLGWSIGAGLAGLIAGLLMSAHDYRRRGVRPRLSFRAALWMLPILVVCLMMVAAWGAAVSAVGIERFLPAYLVIAWLLNTGFLLILRLALHAVRRRRGLI